VGNCGTDVPLRYRNVDNTMRAYPRSRQLAQAGILPDKVAFLLQDRLASRGDLVSPT
jgi:hypothetical protein